MSSSGYIFKTGGVGQQRLIDNNGLVPASQGAESALTAAHVLTAYPNPNRGDQLNIGLSSIDGDVRAVGVEFFDVFGKQVIVSKVPAQKGAFNTTLDLTGPLAEGVYLMRMTAGLRPSIDSG